MARLEHSTTESAPMMDDVCTRRPIDIQQNSSSHDDTPEEPSSKRLKLSVPCLSLGCISDSRGRTDVGAETQRPAPGRRRPKLCIAVPLRIRKDESSIRGRNCKPALCISTDAFSFSPSSTRCSTSARSTAPRLSALQTSLSSRSPVTDSACTGYNVDSYAEGPVAVIPGLLYLGSESCANSEKYLRRLGIRAIVNAAAEITRVPCLPHLDNNVDEQSYLHYPLTHHFMVSYLTPSSTESADISPNSFAAFVHGHVTASRPVLVHCQMGRTRSAALVIFYLMFSLGWSWRRAMAHVNIASKGRIDIGVAGCGWLMEMERQLEKDRPTPFEQCVFTATDAWSTLTVTSPYPESSSLVSGSTLALPAC
ncbi:phosphatases II [Gonapodya prolifera JEL478]|uniref:protein-tyrosine-phosphatase n=1 Tax=Gonapodya prolifera (strain JEL478) TaxID=1344416 RepID=A0A139AUY0_GONPJ|nr:phosphatases II [Gonapodya prolifera JEL478]|eukprot:KXS20517.1 phosphatases II [Gonapodya prolifera JEL478]